MIEFLLLEKNPFIVLNVDISKTDNQDNQMDDEPPQHQADRTRQHLNNTQRPPWEKRPFRRVTKVNVWTSRTCSSNTGTTSRREWYPPAIGIRLRGHGTPRAPSQLEERHADGALPAEVARRAVPAPDRSLSEQAPDDLDASRRRLCTGGESAGSAVL